MTQPRITIGPGEERECGVAFEKSFHNLLSATMEHGKMMDGDAVSWIARGISLWLVDYPTKVKIEVRWVRRETDAASVEMRAFVLFPPISYFLPPDLATLRAGSPASPRHEHYAGFDLGLQVDVSHEALARGAALCFRGPIRDAPVEYTTIDDPIRTPATSPETEYRQSMSNEAFAKLMRARRLG